MVGGCVRPSGLWDLVLSALRIVESGFVCPSGVGVDDGGWLCPPFGIVGSGFVRPSDCGIWLCPPFGIVGSGFVRPSGLWSLVLSALRVQGWMMVGGCVRPSGLWDLVLSALRV
jgi:hypothetical protein